MSVLINPFRFGAAAAFDPRDLSNLEFFVDADLSTFTVSQWDDLSGNGRHAEQGTAADQPAKNTSGGFEVIDFDGTSDFMSWNGTAFSLTAYTFLWIGRHNSVSSTGNTWFSLSSDGGNDQNGAGRGRYQQPGGNNAWHIRAVSDEANEFNAEARIDTGSDGLDVFAWVLVEMPGSGGTGIITTDQGTTDSDSYGADPEDVEIIAVAARSAFSTFGSFADISVRACLLYSDVFTGDDRTNLIAWADDKIT